MRCWYKPAICWRQVRPYKVQERHAGSLQGIPGRPKQGCFWAGHPQFLLGHCFLLRVPGTIAPASAAAACASAIPGGMPPCSGPPMC